jgi:hypothetical protein
MAGHSRSKNGVVEFILGLAEGKTRGLAYVPAIHVFGLERKSWMRGTGLHSGRPKAGPRCPRMMCLE